MPVSLLSLPIRTPASSSSRAARSGEPRRVRTRTVAALAAILTFSADPGFAGGEPANQALWDLKNQQCGDRKAATVTEMDAETEACWSYGPVTGCQYRGPSVPSLYIKETVGPTYDPVSERYDYVQHLHCTDSTDAFRISIAWDRLQCVDSNELGEDANGDFGICPQRPEAERRENLANAACNPKDGNPCEADTGNKIIQETDFEGVGLHFYRTWHSMAPKNTSVLGSRWVHSYLDYLELDALGDPVAVITPDGYYMTLTEVGGTVFIAPERPDLRVRASGSSFVAEYGNRERRTYDSSGKLTVVEAQPGQQTTLNYDATTGRLQTIVGPFGHRLSLSYHWFGYLSHLVWPDGRYTQYLSVKSNGNRRLETVTSPSHRNRFYLYEDANHVDYITGITDELGNRYATYTYDATTGKVLTSEHAGGAGKVTLSYGSSATTVTDGDGRTKTYDFSVSPWTGNRLNSTSRNGTTRSITYAASGTDALQRRATVTRPDGVVVGYSYDSHHRTAVTEAVGTAEERTTNYEYLRPDSNRVTKISRPSLNGAGNAETAIAYNGLDLPTSITESGYDASGAAISRTTTVTYNASGQVLTIDGPRTDVVDVTTFTYHTCSTGAECGQLHTVTNAEGHTTTFDTYDAAGRLTKETGPNGYVREYRYASTTGYPQSVTIRTPYNRHWTYDYEYNAAGLMTRAPAGRHMSAVYWSYDEAHRPIEVRDNLGDKIKYAYDSAGNVTETRYETAAGQLARQVQAAYDDWSRLDTINRGGSVTDLLFDAVGNLEKIEDANLRVTSNVYDALNRLVRSTDPALGQTDYSYDEFDRLTQVSAPNGATTVYTHDDFGRVASEQSPDRGTTTYTYDEADNVLTRTDARGITATYTYDALNRTTSITYPDATKNVVMGYDAGPHNAGFLTSMADESGTTTWNHYTHGPGAYYRTLTKTQVSSGVTLVTQHIVSAINSRLQETRLPSGKTISYTYNSNQLVGSITVDSTPVLSGATYEPFGPANGWTWGDATVSNWVYDLRGLPTSHSLAADTRTLGYDNVGQIVTLDDARHDLAFDYDALGRLFDFDALGLAPLTSQDFSYDANANRLSFTEGTSYPYTVTPNSNRVTTVAGPVPKTYSYDAAGNITSDGSTTYTYDDRGRLVTAGTASYTYNGLGQRVKKDNGTVTLFVYDEAGNLIGEYDAAGHPIREHVWFAGAPVAVIVGSDVHYVHTDHLGTPRAITDAGTVIWRWESDPFGSTAADEDPDGDLTSFTYNLRFPGQYYDSESGLHYNYFRTYDPSTGRYLESDPIGLLGGSNTYAYVESQPTMMIDPLGLFGRDFTGRDFDPAELARRKMAHCVKQAFFRNYMDMRQANTKFQDKYFHCKANCEGARCGPGASEECEAISNSREFFDRVKGDPASASRADQAANRYGREQSIKNPGKSCRQICSVYRPNGLPPQY